MKTGKNLRMFGVRGSLIGDSIMALPILNYVERLFPNSYKYWQIARKCSQSAQLYFNHSLIDQIVISDGDEGMGTRDREIATGCDIIFNVMPQHPEGDSWPNRRNIYEETWVMAGLPLSEYHNLPIEEQRPKLTKWFNINKKLNKTIAIWPCAGYGKEKRRSPSQKWYFDLTIELRRLGYEVIQFGHPNDFSIHNEFFTSPPNPISAVDHRGMSFFDQIQVSLGCDLVIGTDSGSSLVIGAYDLIPQITLLTNHWPGHVRNFTAFATNAPKNHNIFAENGADNISIFNVLEKIKELIPI